MEAERDLQTGLERWHWHGNGVTFTFNQLLPDQSRAFFQGRGLRPEAADTVATACVFQAIVRNGAEVIDALELNLGDWRVIDAQGHNRPPRLEADWQRQWQQQGVSQPARIAFRWALFPTRQRFEPGDWNMGMVTFDLPPGSRFELKAVWLQDGKRREAIVNGLRCAPDRQP
jgi:hypothetical protein